MNAQKMDIRKTVKEWLLLLLGTTLTAAGVYFFKFPNNFSTGGVSGISVILGHYFPSATPGDFVMGINMAGTLTILSVLLLSRLLEQDWLLDVALIYVMLSFLAVVLLTKIYMGVYREKRRREEEENHAA